MSLIDKLSRPLGGGLDPLLDSSLPAWKKDLILKKRAMNRTFPFLLSSVPAEFNRAKFLDEKPALPPSPVHAWRATEGSGACPKKPAEQKARNEGDATQALQCVHDWKMVEEQVSANDIDGGIVRLELIGHSGSNSTSPSLLGGSQQSLVYDQESSSENEEEYEYGPGIVNRLRSKFISLTLRDACGPPTTPPPQPNFVPVRRVASMEHLLDEPFYPVRRSDLNKAVGSTAAVRSTTEVLKRARSMDTLSVIDRAPPTPTNFRFLFRGYSREDGLPLSPVNDNVIIIEQPKLPQSCAVTPGLRLAQDGGGRKGSSLTLLDEDEFPKPDTVRTCKKIFEHSLGDVTVSLSGAAVKQKVTPPPKPPGLKPGPKPKVIARRIQSAGSTKPVFKLLEPKEILREGSESQVGAIVEDRPDVASGTRSLMNGVVDDTVAEIPEDCPGPVHCLESLQSGPADPCAIRNDVPKNDVLNPPNEPLPTATLVVLAATDEACDRPKVVSIQPKSEEKDRPIGHIRPFQTVEQNSTTFALGQDDTDVSEHVPNGSDALTTYAFLPKKSVTPPGQGPVSQTFNFVGKQVQAHISNNAAPFDFRRRTVRQIDRVSSTNEENLTPHSNGTIGSYIIVGDDGTVPGFAEEYSDEDDGYGADTLGDLVTSSARVAFVGDNIIVGRSALIKTRNKKCSVCRGFGLKLLDHRMPLYPNDGGVRPGSDLNLPDWKKDLIKKRRDMQRTFPLLLAAAPERWKSTSVANHGRPLGGDGKSAAPMLEATRVQKESVENGPRYPSKQAASRGRVAVSTKPEQPSTAGIVDKMCFKFKQLTSQESSVVHPSISPVRRTNSLEHLLDVNVKEPATAWPLGWARAAIVVPTALKMSSGPNRPKRPKASVGSKSGVQGSSVPLTPFNKHMIIIEQSRPVESVERPRQPPSMVSPPARVMDRRYSFSNILDENELPKPDTVSNFKKIFEKENSTSNSKTLIVRGKLTLPAQKLTPSKTNLGASTRTFGPRSPAVEGAPRKNAILGPRTRPLVGTVSTLAIFPTPKPRVQLPIRTIPHEMRPVPPQPAKEPVPPSLKYGSHSKVASGPLAKPRVSMAPTAGIRMSNAGDATSTVRPMPPIATITPYGVMGISSDRDPRSSSKSRKAPASKHSIPEQPKIAPLVLPPPPVIVPEEIVPPLPSPTLPLTPPPIEIVPPSPLPTLPLTPSPITQEAPVRAAVPTGELVVVGDNVIVGRSVLNKTRTKKLKIAFDDQAVSTYEYPSENSLLENELHGDVPPGIGSASGLGSYTPLAVGSAHVFKLGEMPAPQAQTASKTNPSSPKDETTEDDVFLKPAPDDQNQVWSSAETSDMLF